VLRTYAEVGNPYMVNAGCEIPPGTPPANLKALCEPVPHRP
jgi:uroporphyrinogen decarboxylase